LDERILFEEFARPEIMMMYCVAVLRLNRAVGHYGKTWSKTEVNV